MVETKHCPGCNEVKLVTDFHVRSARLCGRQSRCKECASKARRAKYPADRAAIAERHRKWAVANKEYLAEYARNRYTENPSRVRAQQRASYAADPAKHREQARAYRAASPEKYRARQRAQRRADPKRHQARKREYYAADPAKHRMQRRLWIAANPEKHQKQHQAATQRRRSRKKQLPATLTPPQWAACLGDHGHCCAYCGVHWLFCGVLHQEHLVPIAIGGGYVEGNIVPACQSCNSSKGTLTAVEFIWQRACA